MPKAEKSLKELLHEIRRIEEHRKELTDKKIKAIYRTLEKELKNYLAEGYEKYADKDGRFYLAYLDAQNKKAQFFREIAENVDSISPQLKKEMLALVDEVYSESYKGMSQAVKDNALNVKELERVAADLDVNPDVLKQAVNNNVSKLTLPRVMEKHRAEIVYQIQQTLVTGLTNGDRYEKMAKDISERIGVSESKAMNITRTETHRNIESGFLDCAERIQEKMDGSGYIYAGTWRTMKDERVRPQQRRKTKSGWKTTISKNGANHIKMEGQTVKVGEFFNLGGGVKAKAPSQSGVAAHDCNCRCFLEYNLMTVEEFAKATGQTTEQVRSKYKIGQNDEVAEKESAKQILTPQQTVDKAKQIAKEIEDSEEVYTFEKIFKTVLNKQGNDGLPKVIPASEFETVSQGKPKLYRGYHADEKGGLSVDEMIYSFKYGELYCGNSGGAAYGRGTYFTPDELIARNDYAYNGGQVIEAILDETSNVANYRDILDELFKSGILREDTALNYVAGDVGSYAALKGYDAVSMNGYQGQQHYIVLNRTKLIIKE